MGEFSSLPPVGSLHLLGDIGFQLATRHPGKGNSHPEILITYNNRMDIHCTYRPLTNCWISYATYFRNQKKRSVFSGSITDFPRGPCLLPCLSGAFGNASVDAPLQVSGHDRHHDRVKSIQNPPVTFHKILVG